jgi:eukaryotic-like serine/threonine-protein kinase
MRAPLHAMTGQLVGHYRVIESIGAGGMGEVFRAHDERLGRDVALKLIRPASSDNPDHLRRFELEARAAAALNHPNIVAIYDVGLEGDTPYIVSELLEGETLRQRLTESPLSFRQVIDYAIQIVDGLIAAHDHRIVHRDLKPENLFLTRDGRAKILDFGVAKLQAEPEADRSVETLTTVTKAGAVIGTVAYMSPEQLRGKAVDHRSDIFSVGAILYEMVTGRRAFRGETAVDTMTAVLREEPPEINLEQMGIPSASREIIRHCLEKEPENRFQSARDLAFALETLAGTSKSKGVRLYGDRSRAVKTIPWAVAGVLLVATLLLFIRGGHEPPPTYKRLTFEEGTVYSARFTPDGQSIIYGAAWNGKRQQLYSTVGNSLLAQPLLDMNDTGLLGISRSLELAVLRHGAPAAHLESEHGTLARAPMAGGSPREVLADVQWADWNANGELAVVHHTEGHSRLEYPIGHVLYESAGWISHIRFSPQGDKIAFMDHPALYDDGGSVSVSDLSGKVRALSSGWESEDGLAWQPNGKEIWFTAVEKGYNRNLLAVDLSGKTRRLLDLPVGLTLQDVAADGRVLASSHAERLGMAAITPENKTEVELSWHDWNIAKDISRDGKWVLSEDASEIAGSNYAVVLRSMDGTPPILLGEGSAGGLSPDGKWAIAVSGGAVESVKLLPTGAGQSRQVDVGGLVHIHNNSARFLADGKRIIINGKEPGHAMRCFLVNLEGGKPRPITPEGTRGGAVSPDGRYVTGFGTDSEIALYPLDGGPPHLIPHLDRGFIPVQWSDDSSAVYGYIYGELPGKVYRVDISTGTRTLIQELRPGVPAGVVSVAPVVVNHDGTRFAYNYYQNLSQLLLISGLR